ncbi:hypothetical protein BSM4216_3230 [Bacillus smithii]|nr:hypothetical protein BSM4216_3230 [Bacillus smithii]
MIFSSTTGRFLMTVGLSGIHRLIVVFPSTRGKFKTNNPSNFIAF